MLFCGSENAAFQVLKYMQNVFEYIRVYMQNSVIYNSIQQVNIYIDCMQTMQIHSAGLIKHLTVSN